MSETEKVVTIQDVIEWHEASASGLDEHHRNECPYCAASRLSIQALREKLERENPKPLTPEELKQRIGKPVWTVGVSYTDDGSWSMWDIVESCDDNGITFGYSTETREWWSCNFRWINDELLVGGWVAYDHKPERSIENVEN